MITYTFIAAFLIMATSLIGFVSANNFLSEKINKNSRFLTSFSAGVFVSITTFMLFESFEILNSIFIISLFIILGYILSIFIEKAVPDFHHHHSSNCHSHASGKKVLIGAFLHSVVDGIVLVPAFLISPTLGIATSASIFIHEILKKLSEFLVLRSMSYSVKKSILFNFISSFGILFGIAVGLLFSETEKFQAILLSMAAGFLLNLLFSDLVPHKHIKNEKNKNIKIFHIFLLLIGFSVFTAVNLMIINFI